jgi:uncharacterized protein
MPSAIPQDLLQEKIEKEFHCHRCGNCCKGDGLVHFGPAEADAMAACLAMKRADFIKKYGIRVKENYWMLRDKLIEIPGGKPELWCIFLELGADGLYGCSVNTGKPRQCATFPAKWRNSDSVRTCAGLRAVVKELREELERAGA